MFLHDDLKHEQFNQEFLDWILENWPLQHDTDWAWMLVGA